MGATSLVRAAADGCYDAQRAAALSGVPKTTIYWWANHGIVVPSVSPERVRLWSYADLMALRMGAWLRHDKPSDDGQVLPASPMTKVRRALALLDEASRASYELSSTVTPEPGEWRHITCRYSASSRRRC